MIVPKVSDILGIVNKFAPFRYAEDWDNVGLQVGNPGQPAGRIMVSLDTGHDALSGALSAGCNLLLTHHPFIFKPLKKISLADPVGQQISLAIKNDLAVVSLHTNLDVVCGGVNDLLARLLGLVEPMPLKPSASDDLVKLAVFVPRGNEEQVMEALFRYGGGIGNYRECSFQSAGTGTFKPLEGAQPYLGRVGQREYVEETRVEVLLRKSDISSALSALVKAHPYEEPAYDLFPLLNKDETTGMGRIGTLQDETTLDAFARVVRNSLGVQCLRVVGPGGRKVRKVAVCGGSGAFLVRDAARQGADVLVTGDIKYHDARDAELSSLTLIDAGHFGTERPMIRGVAEQLTEELRRRNFAAEVLAFEGEQEPFRHV